MSKVYHREASKRLLKSKVKMYKRAAKSTVFAKQDNIFEKSCIASCNSIKHESPKNVYDTSHLLPVLDILEKLNFKYEVIPGAQTKHACFFVQDNVMNAFFNYYPEYVCFDVFCDIPELDYSLVLFIGLDANGHCEILAIGLIKSENFQGFSWLCDVFKKRNPSWGKIEFIISDQNFDNREILIKAFPEKLIFISFFHSMKAFKRELSNLTPFVSNQDINKALQIFEQMMYVTSESGYIELQKQLKQISPPVFNLFKKNWHLKKDLWALGLYSDSKIFLKAFNSYLLDIRRKVKPTISTQKSLEDVILKLHSAISKLRKEWFLKFTSMFQNPSLSYSKVRVMQRFSKYLTPFATELINEQLTYSEKIKNVQKIDHATYKVNETVVSFNTCCCNFHTLMMLPCCHIFAVRNFLSLPLFVDSLRLSWTSSSYRNTFCELYSVYSSDKSETTETTEKNERYQQCIETSQELWSQILCSSEDISQERLEVFQTLLKAWKSNFKIDIKLSEKQNDFSSCSAEILENASTDYFKEMYGISLNDIVDSENEFSSISLCSEDSDLF